MKKNFNRSHIQLIIIVLCAIALVICAFFMIRYLLESDTTTKQTEKLKKEYVIVERMPIDDTDEQTENDKSYIAVQPIPVEKDKLIIDGREYDTFADMSVPKRKIDFDGIQSKENKDIYAWIYIPNTNVDYPILQHEKNNAFYLDHDMNGKKASCGSIFTENYNNTDFNDNHTVVYGHNMKNGSMFKSLRNYDEKIFFDENPYIYVYTEWDTRVYEIFGAYEYDDRHLLTNFETKNSGEFQKYLESVKKLGDSCGHFNRDLTVNSNDKIITLSTCISGKPSSRYLVQGKLIAVEEN